MTLEALASVIKVTPNKLEALEQGRYNALPDASFTRALAMTVCRALKIEPGPVLAGLPAAQPAALASDREPLNQPFKEGRGSALFDKHFDWSGLLSPRYMAPMGILVAAAVIHFLPEKLELPSWLQRNSQPEAVIDASSAASSVEPVVVAVEPAVTEPASTPMPLVLDADMNASAPASGAASSESASSAEAVVPAHADSPSAAVLSMSPSVAAPALASASGNISLDISDDSWIEIKDANGQKVFSRLAKAGEQVALEGAAPIQVRIGNVSGVQMRYKGQAVDLSTYTRSNVARFELK